MNRGIRRGALAVFASMVFATAALWASPALALVQPAVSAAWEHTVGLRLDGTAVAVGFPYTGLCNVAGWTDLESVSAGANHTVGLKSDGTVVATGDNGYYECEVSGWQGITAVSAGYYFTLGLKSDHTVVAAGWNYFHQSDVSGWTGIAALSGGYYHSVGLKSDGSVVATGDNTYGQCDVSGWKNITAVSAGQYHTVALKSDGTVVATGDDSYGQCDVSGWTGITAVSAGYDHTVGLKADGTVVSTGSNLSGEGDVSGWTGVRSLSAGHFYTVGLKSDGTVLATGWNYYGQADVAGWFLPSVPQDVADAVLGGVDPHYAYTGAPIEPVPSVVVAGRTLSGGSDYDVAYSNNTQMGTATLTITGKGNYAGTASRTFAIGLAIDPPAAAVRLGGTVALTVVGGTGPTVWSSSATAVASVSAGGVVTGSRVGTAVISATRGTHQGFCAVTVMAPALSSAALSVPIGKSATLSVVGGTGAIAWSSSRRAVATVSKSGVVMGVSSGTVTIAAVRNGVKMTCEVTVTKRDYRLSISHGVAGGKGYIYVTVKTWNRHALKARKISFYRDGVYLGEARSNAKGTARLNVAKDMGKPHDYDGRLAADGSHEQGLVSHSFRFVKRIFLLSGHGAVSRSVSLRKGTYWLWVRGDGALTGILSSRLSRVGVYGGDGSWVIFKVYRAGKGKLTGSSSVSRGVIKVSIERVL